MPESGYQEPFRDENVPERGGTAKSLSCVFRMKFPVTNLRKPAATLVPAIRVKNLDRLGCFDPVVRSGLLLRSLNGLARCEQWLRPICRSYKEL
jgi:hypothetical protein